MRAAAAEQYRNETGDTWRPRRGSHTSQTGKLTSEAIDARDYLRARKDRKTMAHLPQGTLVAIAGGKHVDDPASVTARLDQTRAKYADIVLVHGDGPGVEKIAVSWASATALTRSSASRTGTATAASLRSAATRSRSTSCLRASSSSGSGITESLVDRARQLGIPVTCAA